MTLLLVGGGGREHAILKKLREDPEVGTVYVLPGNGGMAQEAVCVPIAAKDIDGIVNFAVAHRVDFAVVAPDDPLVLGCVDRLEQAGIPAFGPTAAAAAIEGSKVFAKELMARYGIPTAAYRVFDSAEAALDYIETAPLPTVVKADGLALGKGVIIAQTREEAKAAVTSIMTDRLFGESGSRIVIEEFLTGPEVSVLAFTDGKTIRPMVSSMDHKRVFDHDRGPNTGGMGAVAPNPFYTPAVADECMRTIFRPTVDAMAQEGRPFRGCLYFGLMLTPDGPKVIEYNCRFGDPETQAVLPLLKSSLLTIMRACRSGTLADCDVRFADGASACVVMASGGYPQSYAAGYPIDIPADVLPSVFFAGVKDDGSGRLLTAGGRVLGVSAAADTLPDALSRAYENIARIHFENAHFRRDIGARACQAIRKD